MRQDERRIADGLTNYQLDSSLWNPAMLIAGIILLAIVEGALRKWAFGSNALLRYATYFSKDLLFFYAGYLGLKRTQLFDTKWLIVCTALIIVPSAGATLVSSNPVGVFLSLRAYLLIPACAFFAASLIRSFRDVERCALLIAISAVFVALLSSYQYSLPANHFLNRYASGDEDIHIVATAGHVRATGTFAFISGMSMFAGLSGWAGTFLSLPVAGRSVWVRAVGVVALAAGFICASTAMSRSGLMFWGVAIAGGCLLYFRPKQIVAFALALLILVPLLPGAEVGESEDAPPSSDSLTTGLADRFEKADTISERAGFMWMNFVLGISNHPLGEGLGTGQPGGQYAAGAQQNGAYESEWGRIAFEIGPIGLATVLLMRFVTFRYFWQQLSRTNNANSRLVLATTLPYFGLMSLGWMAFNHTGNTFIWAVAALGLATVAEYGSAVKRFRGVVSEQRFARAIHARR